MTTKASTKKARIVLLLVFSCRLCNDLTPIREMRSVFSLLLASLCVADTFFLVCNIILTPIALGRRDLFTPGKKNFPPADLRLTTWSKEDRVKVEQKRNQIYIHIKNKIAPSRDRMNTNISKISKGSCSNSAMVLLGKSPKVRQGFREILKFPWDRAVGINCSIQILISI